MAEPLTLLGVLAVAIGIAGIIILLKGRKNGNSKFGS